MALDGLGTDSDWNENWSEIVSVVVSDEIVEMKMMKLKEDEMKKGLVVQDE